MLRRRAGQDEIDLADIKQLERDLTEAENDLDAAVRHNSNIEGRIEAADESLKEMGYQTVRSAKRAADQIEKRVEKKVDKLNTDLDKFVEDFDALKEALP